MPLNIKGAQETIAGLNATAKALEGDELVAGMKKAVLLVERDARKYAPVDTGHLRASITSDVVATPKTFKGIVGSNVEYAPYMELGARPHFPPPGVLETWARRHGMNAFLVARAISRRGLRPRRYLRRAFKDNEARIKTILGESVRGIIRRKR